MTKVPILIALLSQLFCTLLQVSGQQSPCPRHFKYINNPATNDVMGRIEIPSPPKNVELHLKVALSINVSLSRNNVGQLKLAQSKEESVRAVQEGPRATGQNVTSIQLKHTLYPSKVLPLSQSSLPINYQTLDIYDSTFLPSSLLLASGKKTMPGQWPWLVAIFVVKISFEFQCAGSILTNKHIITAAHCFKLNAQTNIPPSAIVVSLGRYRLRDFHEVGSINKEIARYTIHPDYIHQKTSDSDLAILVLRDPVEFSPLIKPVWIWNGPTDLQSVINKTGCVVGWGRDEFNNPYLEELRMTNVPIVSQEVCLRSDPRFAAFTSYRTFCAGTLHDSCNGDSGSGLVIFDSTTGYQLRGVLSQSLYDSCGLTYFVFVDVAKYVPLNWTSLDNTIESVDVENVALLRYINPHVWIFSKSSKFNDAVGY